MPSNLKNLWLYLDANPGPVSTLAVILAVASAVLVFLFG